MEQTDGQRSPVRVVLQGFAPFGPFAMNPSEQIVERIAALPEPLERVDLRTAVLTVAEAPVRAGVRELFDRHHPDVWIGLGLWNGRADLTIERFATNVRDFFIPDAEGGQPRDEVIDPALPTTLRSSLPTGEILAAWEAEGIVGRESNAAGTYLCNLSLFQALTAARTSGCLTGFVHLPSTPEMTQSEPTLALDTQVRAVIAAIRVSTEAARRTRD